MQSKLTAVSVPVKVVLWIARALVVQAILLTSRAVGEGNMVICDVVEEMYLLLLEHKSSGDGVDRRVTPALVEETTGMVQGGEVVDVGIGAEPIQVADLEVGPEMAVVVRLSIVLADPLQRVSVDNVLGVYRGEVLDSIPQRGDGLDVFVQAEGEAVLLLVVGHELERVVVDVAVQLDAGLDAPVPLVVQHQGVAEEEAGLVTAHVPVADGVAVDDLLLLHFLADLGSAILVDEVGERPVLLGDLAVLGLARHKSGGDLLELVVEIIVVEEDPVVVELAVETVFDVADGFGDLPDVRVAGKGHEGCVHALAVGGGRRELVGGVGRCRRRLLVGARLGRCWLVCGRVCDRLALVALVRGPLRGRDRRRRRDEEEEDDGLVRSASGPAEAEGETYHESEDDVAQVALLAGHGAAGVLLRALRVVQVLVRSWDRRLVRLRLALLRRGALHLGSYSLGGGRCSDCSLGSLRLRRRLRARPVARVKEGVARQRSHEQRASIKKDTGTGNGRRAVVEEQQSPAQERMCRAK